MRERMDLTNYLTDIDGFFTGPLIPHIGILRYRVPERQAGIQTAINPRCTSVPRQKG
jgi:hypothetical protein